MYITPREISRSLPIPFRGTEKRGHVARNLTPLRVYIYIPTHPSSSFHSFLRCTVVYIALGFLWIVSRQVSHLWCRHQTPLSRGSCSALSMNAWEPTRPLVYKYSMGFSFSNSDFTCELWEIPSVRIKKKLTIWFNAIPVRNCEENERSLCLARKAKFIPVTFYYGVETATDFHLSHSLRGWRHIEMEFLVKQSFSRLSTNYFLPARVGQDLWKFHRLLLW